VSKISTRIGVQFPFKYLFVIGMYANNKKWASMKATMLVMSFHVEEDFDSSEV